MSSLEYTEHVSGGFMDTGTSCFLTFSEDGRFTRFERGVGDCEDEFVAGFVRWG